MPNTKLTKAEIERLNTELESKSPQEILSWAIKTFSPGVGLSSSFGGESAGLIHMVTQIDPSIPVLFLDTGFLFKETHAFKDELQKKFHLNIRAFNASPAQIEQTKKNLLTKDKTGLCCDDAKIDLMNQSLKGLTCWIAGLRRNQSSTRKNIKIVEDYADGLVKVHPLANWTSKEIYGYMKQHNLPFHPLWEKGFRSIGCEPCTQAPLPGQDDRSGRWAGLEKTECGIHTYQNRKKE